MRHSALRSTLTHGWPLLGVLIFVLILVNSVVVYAAPAARGLPASTPSDWQLPPAPPAKGSDAGDNSQAGGASELTDEQNSELAVSNLDDVQMAVVQIEAVGSFADPQEGLVANAAGRGSGFIIDESGMAVTNHHVVTGAAFLKVFVAGEEEPRNARVLGVSECSDLAVIDIQGEGFRYLEWSEQRIKVGLEIYAAGFPLGDPEYTLTRGIIAKANADGESSWASVDHVIQHDASTNPGNSGGPIVDSDGRVVAVHYAGAADVNQQFAIAADEALPILDQLATGEDVNTMGINGEAVVVGEDLTGIWVASVASGSVADNAGVKPGDVIMSMEGVSLATEGAMTEYCDILRSHSPEDVLAIQVLRLETGEVLEGQFNGRPLEMSFSIAEQIEESGEQPGGPGSGNVADYDEYVTVRDDSGILSVEVPAAWDDLEGSAWVVDDNEVGVRLMAAPDLKAMTGGWDTPGLFFGASADLAEKNTPEEMLDNIDYGDACEYSGREEIPDGFYTGHFDTWTDCGDAKSTAVVVALVPENKAYIVQLEIYTVSEADLKALDHILDSFAVNVEEEPSTDQPASDEGVIDTSELQYDYTWVYEPALNVLLPEAYDDVQSGDWESDGEVIGMTLYAATNIKKYQDTWTTPGVYVRTATGLTEDIDINDWLDEYDLSDNCERGDRVKHNHTIYEYTYKGAYDIWTDCENSGNAFVHLVAVTDPPDQLVLIDFQAIDEADVEAIDVLLRSFYVESDTGGGASGAEPAVDPDDYMTVTDDDGILSVRVPKTWSDINDGNWVMDDETVGASVSASPNLEQYNDTWTMPGLFFGATIKLAENMDAEELLDEWTYNNDCAGGNERLEYDDAVFMGHYDIWSDCGGEGNLFVVLSAAPKEVEGILVLIQVAIPAGESVEAFEQILASFSINDPEGLVNLSNEPDVDVGATAQVLVPTLNVRAGPGTNFNRLAAVNKDDQLTVVGQVNNCAWLQVLTPDGQSGWVSGGQQYVALNAACADIPEVKAPPAAGGSGGSGAATANKGCITFKNFVGDELTVTFTKKDGSWNKTFKVAKNGQQRECFDPGKYTYTLSAPGFESGNNELTINKGDNFEFPVTAE